MLLEIIQQLGVTGIIVGGAVYGARRLFEHLVSVDLEQHKADLQAENDRAVEQLRSDLSRAALEHQVRFTELHERRADIIAATYGRIVQLHGVLKLPSNVAEAHAAYVEFWEHFRKDRIYFSRETCELIDGFGGGAGRVVSDRFIRGLSSPTIEKDFKGDLEAIAKTGELAKIRDRIEEEFRELLGVSGA